MQELRIVQMPGRAWLFEPVIVADSLRRRLRGLRPRSAGRGMLFRGMSVHGFGMDEALVAVFLDADGMVLGAEALAPRAIIRNRHAAWVLELPSGTRPPAAGTRLEVVRRTT